MTLSEDSILLEWLGVGFAVLLTMWDWPPNDVLVVLKDVITSRRLLDCSFLGCCINSDRRVSWCVRTPVRVLIWRAISSDVTEKMENWCVLYWGFHQGVIDVSFQSLYCLFCQFFMLTVLFIGWDKHGQRLINWLWTVVDFQELNLTVEKFFCRVLFCGKNLRPRYGEVVLIPLNCTN